MARRKQREEITLEGKVIVEKDHLLFIERAKEHDYEVYLFAGKPHIIVKDLVTASMQLGVELRWDYTGLGIAVHPAN